MRRREEEEELAQPLRGSSRQRAAPRPTRARPDRGQATPATSPPLGSGPRGSVPRGTGAGPRPLLRDALPPCLDAVLGAVGLCERPGLREQHCHAAVISSSTTAYPWGIPVLKLCHYSPLITDIIQELLRRSEHIYSHFKEFRD